jgi:MFS-type transporter involved in bile tolerance (Atg22 family)
MWPGTISISAQKCPKGGTAMFAFLALAGDLGAAIGPSMVGTIADAVGGDLKTGLLFATVFPAILIFGLIALIKKFGKAS